MKTDAIGQIVKEQTKKNEKKKGAIPIALHADNGNLKHSSKYFWDVSTILFSSDEYTCHCSVACCTFLLFQLSACKLQNALQFNMAEFKSLKFFNELRDLVVFPDLVLFGIISTVSLIWLEWY